MPTKPLSPDADLRHLKHQAKDLLTGFRAQTPAALQRVREFHPRHTGLTDGALQHVTFTLSDAYVTLAREYGYASWPRLKTVVAERSGTTEPLIHNDRIGDPVFLQALDFLDEGQTDALAQHLRAHPDLVDQRVRFEGDNYFTNPTLLEFVAENPIRQGVLPRNIVDVARVILDAGASRDATILNDTLELVASGRIARESGVQTPLIAVLCQSGADPNSAMLAALGHREVAAAEALIAQGAAVDLPVAAALGRADQVQAMSLSASPDALQLALALCAVHGHAGVATILIDAGADPNRYNPPGGHSHCTPLHSAVWEGHFDTVKALVSGGARTDIGDIHHGANAQDWAKFAGHSQIAAFLA